jgi:hypothetical protein
MTLETTPCELTVRGDAPVARYPSAEISEYTSGHGGPPPR